MDESLSEFQEKKSSSTGPKNADKANETKAKPKKRLKRIIGQKDIRTALKPKKNELISYANDFNKICKQSGIDVDSEQLQLAIALSKSLQQSETNSVESQSTSSNRQEKVNKIRTTLQEYGFKVPEVKATKKKKLKTRKYHKLLLSTQVEKQQIIFDKFSQVLFKNLSNFKNIENAEEFNIPKVHLYNIATDITYELIRSDNFYHIEGLIDKHVHSVGCLLRDWSEIPGRPTSPKLEQATIPLDEIECSQEELDSILSGSLKSAQDIIKSKCKLLIRKEPGKLTPNMDTSVIELVGDGDDEVHITGFNPGNATEDIVWKPYVKEFPEKFLKDTDIETITLVVPHQLRSCSPDIFDDEVSSILDTSKEYTEIISQEIKNITRENTDVMDLTECVNAVSQRNTVTEKAMSQLSHGSNITKRKTNDFMEITDCVAVSSQPILEENIDLTQNTEDVTDVGNIKENQAIEIESTDLTQSSNASDDSLPFVHISGKDKSIDDTIIINYDEVNDVANTFVSEEKRKEHITVFGDFKEDVSPKNDVSLDKNNYVYNVSFESSISEGKRISSEYNINHNEKVDLTKNVSTNKAEKYSTSNYTSKTESFFGEFVYQQESSEDVCNQQKINDVSCIDDVVDDKVTECRASDNSNNGIDLTQSTDSSEGLVDIDEAKSPLSYNTNTLGKNADVSIDYDEMFDELVMNHPSNSNQSLPSCNSIVYDIPDDNNTVAVEIIAQKSKSDLQSSQNSEGFEISDKELNYSIHRARYENFDIGGLMDNLSEVRRSKSITNGDNNVNMIDSMSDSFLPMVDLKGKDNEAKLPSQESFNEASTSKITMISDKLPATTPKSGGYVIKVDNVTPVSDYASMSTPERNNELDKYGVKPLKRRRAVQLLTHIYNQTHPIVESYSNEDVPSPSKKIKISRTESQKSPNKLPKTTITKSPKKKIEKQTSKRTNADEDKDNDMYEVLSEVPVIRDIGCCEDDWVFQKREKAKLHTCRVPLHVAMHNYTSARPRLREAILRYEPVDIDVVHRGLAAAGHRYHPKDLLKFMDKKCVTVKTADNNSRNKKHY